MMRDATEDLKVCDANVVKGFVPEMGEMCRSWINRAVEAESREAKLEAENANFRVVVDAARDYQRGFCAPCDYGICTIDCDICTVFELKQALEAVGVVE